VKIAIINRTGSNRIELSPTALARVRWALYLALVAAWIIIAFAQFMVDTANASNSTNSSAEPDKKTGIDLDIKEEWRPIPASIIG
jgi:hypothetical protein